MPAPRRYPDELRERSVRLVVEAMAEDPSLSLDAAVNRVGVRVGVVPDTLRGWAKQYRVNTGQAPGTTTSDARRIKDLEHEVRELKRANEILLASQGRVGDGGPEPTTTDHTLQAVLAHQAFDRAPGHLHAVPAQQMPHLPVPGHPTTRLALVPSACTAVISSTSSPSRAERADGALVLAAK